MNIITTVIKAEKWNNTYTFPIVYTNVQKHLWHICVNNAYNIHIVIYIIYNAINVITLNSLNFRYNTPSKQYVPSTYH